MLYMLDAIRSAAKREAWRPDSKNPFCKINSKDVKPDDDESTLRSPINRSEPILTGVNHEYLPHPNTMPSQSRPGEDAQTQVRDMAVGNTGAKGEGRGEKSQDSGTTATSETAVASESVTDGTLENEGKPRRRKTAFTEPSQDGEEEKSTETHRKSSSLFKKDKQKFTAVGQLKATLLNSWINVLLIMVPVGIAVNYTGINRVAVFVINFIAIIPLAAMLSYATEEIALRTGETIGGLLNATFG